MATANPLAELESHARHITPRVLRGKKKELWLAFVKKYADGDYAGLPMRELFEWGKKHCGFNCSVTCFRHELLAAAATKR